MKATLTPNNFQNMAYPLRNKTFQKVQDQQRNPKTMKEHFENDLVETINWLVVRFTESSGLNLNLQEVQDLIKNPEGLMELYSDREVNFDNGYLDQTQKNLEWYQQWDEESYKKAREQLAEEDLERYGDPNLPDDDFILNAFDFNKPEKTDQNLLRSLIYWHPNAHQKESLNQDFSHSAFILEISGRFFQLNLIYEIGKPPKVEPPFEVRKVEEVIEVKATYFETMNEKFSVSTTMMELEFKKGKPSKRLRGFGEESLPHKILRERETNESN